MVLKVVNSYALINGLERSQLINGLERSQLINGLEWPSGFRPEIIEITVSKSTETAVSKSAETAIS